MLDTVSQQHTCRDTRKGARLADDNTIYIKASLDGEIYKDGETGWYVSQCPALAVCSQGGDRKEARKNLIEATELVLETCFESGTLFEVLRDCGYYLSHQQPKAKKDAANEWDEWAEEEIVKIDARKVRFSINIPLHFSR